MEKYCIELHDAGLHKKGFQIEPTTLKIPKGYIICVKGVNGAGKSTFFRMLLGKEKGTFGEIRILEKSIWKDRESILQKVGFISEDNYFYYDEDPLKNELRYASFYTQWNGQVYRDKLKEFDISLSMKINKLSKGNKVRFQLAFALAHSPEILIMDEPTAGLDPVFRTEFYQLLRQLISEEEITVIFSTHLSEEIGEVADYILEIKEGRMEMKEIYY